MCFVPPHKVVQFLISGFSSTCIHQVSRFILFLHLYSTQPQFFTEQHSLSHQTQAGAPVPPLSSRAEPLQIFLSVQERSTTRCYKRNKQLPSQVWAPSGSLLVKPKQMSLTVDLCVLWISHHLLILARSNGSSAACSVGAAEGRHLLLSFASMRMRAWRCFICGERSTSHNWRSDEFIFKDVLRIARDQSYSAISLPHLLSAQFL